MNNQFLVQIGTDADGVLQITAWFLAVFNKDDIDSYKRNVTAWSRGKDWVIRPGYATKYEDLRLREGTVLSAEEVAIVKEAIAALKLGSLISVEIIAYKSLISAQVCLKLAGIVLQSCCRLEPLSYSLQIFFARDDETKGSVVPTDGDYLILHVNKTTGEKSLPQGLCEWLTKPKPGNDSVAILESFEATAKRIMDTQLNCKGNIYGHHPLESPQPYSTKSGVKPKMNAPFLLQTETIPDGAIQVTAWFQVYIDSEKPLDMPITAFARGKDWAVQMVAIRAAIEELSAGDLEAYNKAKAARDSYGYDSDVFSD
ncbi:hypothetical protein MMC30_007296 [Trapelia coarctata]|nr:hypothetical protein [Trapelia coarctata]